MYNYTSKGIYFYLIFIATFYSLYQLLPTSSNESGLKGKLKSNLEYIYSGGIELFKWPFAILIYNKVLCSFSYFLCDNFFKSNLNNKFFLAKYFSK